MVNTQTTRRDECRLCEFIFCVFLVRENSIRRRWAALTPSFLPSQNGRGNCFSSCVRAKIWVMLIMFTLEAALHTKAEQKGERPEALQRNIPHKHLELSSRGVKVRDIWIRIDFHMSRPQKSEMKASGTADLIGRCFTSHSTWVLDESGLESPELSIRTVKLIERSSPRRRSASESGLMGLSLCDLLPTLEKNRNHLCVKQSIFHPTRASEKWHSGDFLPTHSPTFCLWFAFRRNLLGFHSALEWKGKSGSVTHWVDNSASARSLMPKHFFSSSAQLSTLSWLGSLPVIYWLVEEFLFALLVVRPCASGRESSTKAVNDHDAKKKEAKTVCRCGFYSCVWLLLIESKWLASSGRSLRVSPFPLLLPPSCWRFEARSRRDHQAQAVTALSTATGSESNNPILTLFRFN